MKQTDNERVSQCSKCSVFKSGTLGQVVFPLMNEVCEDTDFGKMETQGGNLQHSNLPTIKNY
jgi:hypothetical protein